MVNAPLCEAVAGQLCAHPAYRLLSLRAVPQLPPANIDYTTFTWQVGGHGPLPRIAMIIMRMIILHMVIMRKDRVIPGARGRLERRHHLHVAGALSSRAWPEVPLVLTESEEAKHAVAAPFLKALAPHRRR